MTDDNRGALRASLRQSRRQLSSEQQLVAARALLDLIGHQDFFRVAQRIAFYQLIDGEIDPQLLLNLALSESKACFLPVISRETPEFVSFAPYDTGTPLIENQWGIAEPPSTTIVSPTDFDVVFVPLVGFNKQCFRLGMGKGCYDRTFSFKIFNRRSRPLLVGLAHENQLVTESFPVQSWDVRLDAVATDKKIYRPDTARAEY